MIFFASHDRTGTTSILRLIDRSTTMAGQLEALQHGEVDGSTGTERAGHDAWHQGTDHLSERRSAAPPGLHRNRGQADRRGSGRAVRLAVSLLPRREGATRRGDHPLVWP